MIKFENSTFINRSPQDVFDFVNNPANDAKWQTGVELSEWTSAGPPGVGSTLKSVINFMGRKIESTIEVTIWDPPHRSGLKVLSGPIPFEISVKYEAQGDGTLLTQSGQAEFGGFFKLAEGLVGKQLEKQFKSDNVTLKSLLEKG